MQGCNIEDCITFIQEIGSGNSENRQDKAIRELSNQSWCNQNPISAFIKENCIYGKAYNHILFRKIDSQSFDELYQCRILEHNNLQETTEQLKTDVRKGEESIYEVIFTYRDEHEVDYYPTVAAFVRIIEEEGVDTRIHYPTVLEDNAHNTYSVINVFLDCSEDMVDFKEFGGIKYQQNEELAKKYPEEEKITFHIVNKGFPVKNVSYEICKVNETDQNKLPVKDISVKGIFQSLDINRENEYEIPIPKEDGTYVIYVKTENEDGRIAEYVSNGMVVDTMSPEVMADFYYEEVNEETGKVEKKQLTDVNEKAQNPVYMTNAITASFQINEANLQKVDVEVMATDATGKEVELSRQINEQIEKWKEHLLKYSVGSLTFTEDANYRIQIKATDEQGLTNKETTYCFTIDTKVPEIGSVNINGTDQGKNLCKTWNTFLKNIVFKLFSCDNIFVTLEGADAMSPVKIYYYIADAEKTVEQLDQLNDKQWIAYSKDSPVIIAANQKIIVYEKVVDAAGNKSYFNSNGIITDDQNPEIRVSCNKSANVNGFYSGEIVFSVCVADKMDSKEYACSGLQHVSYRIEKNDKVIENKTIYELKEKELETSINPADHVKEEIQITVQEDFNNSDDIILYVTAIDNAGNKEVCEKRLKVDNVKPEITVTYDKEVVNGKYCNQERTATVTIKERNLYIEDVKLSVSSKKNSNVKIGKWTHSSDVGKSDHATYECKVTFLQDDDYKFAVSCVDQAGNKAKKNVSTAFTLDTTKPVISVSYSGKKPSKNCFYNEEVTATITIKEHNFDAKQVQIHTTGTEKKRKEQSGETVISDVRSKGDEHTVTVRYDTDGRYGLDISYTDEAGNEADQYSSDSFVIDLTKPKVEITNVVDQSANKGDVKPVITCTDANYDASRVSVSLTGSNNGRMDLEKAGYTVSNIKNGQQFGLDFPKTEELDDIYTLTVKIQDKAGNQKKTSIEFSVNRYGSVYTLGEETKAWLKNGSCVYLREEKPIIIIETNVNETTNQKLFYSLGAMDGSVTEIKELSRCSKEEKEKGFYYMVSKIDSGNGWNQRQYVMNSSNFEKEGRYTIHIDSTDKAGNNTSNVSNRHNDGRLEMVFAIDKTAPSVVVSGAENGDVYNAAEHTLFLDVQDNLALDTVTVYVNDKEYGSFTPEDIGYFDNGLIPVTIGESVSMQTIRVVAADKAGNLSSSGGKNAENSQTFENIRILVTTNAFVRSLHTTRMWIFVLLIMAGIVGSVHYFAHRSNRS